MDPQYLINEYLFKRTTGAAISNPSRVAYQARLTCWILRILVGAQGMPAYCETGNPRLGPVAELLQIPALADPDVKPAALQNVLAAALDTVQIRLGGPGLSPPVADCAMLHTVDWLAHSAGLSALERDIFEFALAMRVFRSLRLAVVTWGEVGPAELGNALGCVLNLSPEVITPACQRDGVLFRSGLIILGRYGDDTLDRVLKVPRQLAQRVPNHQGHPSLILSNLVVPMLAPVLSLHDFAYMQADTELAQSWLAGALDSRSGPGQSVVTGAVSKKGGAEITNRFGSHMLVSGAPGLGKTEWVRALLAHLQGSQQPTLKAMELVVLNDDGTALSGEERLNHLRLTMNMFRNAQCGVIVFDEADDVFRGQGEPVDISSGDKAAVSMANHRASLNRMMEDSRIPVIWIMNHPEILDPAVLRRFDTVIAFEGIPRSVRLAMLAHRFGQDKGDQCHPGAELGDGMPTPALPSSYPQEELLRWAELATLTPALIDRLAVVVQRAQDAGTPMNTQQCRHWLRRRLPGKEASQLARDRSSRNLQWRAGAVRASENLAAIIEGVGRVGSARLLLYGPPGTGKTAFAHALARKLDKTLLEQRASDLLSPWVGETEQRISQAFETALKDDAVLFIDEVDSLLASREHAVRNWEVTQVNELLEQLSDFDGIVVLATNRLEALDEAVLRRMDVKIRFDALSGEQLGASFARLCVEQGFSYSLDQMVSAFALEGLTTGDFACVARRLAFAPLGTSLQGTDQGDDVASPQADALLGLLREELRMKTRGKQPIGFHAHYNDASHRPS